MGKLPVMVKKLVPEARVPVYKKEGDAGFDLHCVRDTEIAPGQTAIIPTGLAFAIPPGYEMQIRMRSGAALTLPLMLANAPGTVDSGYRGEVGIIVRNVGTSPCIVKNGERIAQGVIAPVEQALFQSVAELPCSSRGSDGFGSTGSN